ncbi:MAG: HNH endonuclease [Streptomyces sp.]
MSHKTMLNSERRRMRKEQLARRHGRRCAYCRRPFASLREATLDHVAPRSLWRTWRATALVLACESCNTAKADRLPLSLALVLVFTIGREQSTAPVHAVTGEHIHGESIGAAREQSGDRVDRPHADPFTVDWLLLARLAHANQAAFTATWTADPIDRESTPDLRDESRHAVHHAPMSRSIARPDCLRAPRPVRACVRPTGEAVPA